MQTRLRMTVQLEAVDQTIIPGLPDELALICLAKVSHGYHGQLETVSKRWRDVIRSSDYSSLKAREGWCGNWLFVQTEGTIQWIAYDPEADRWHPLPTIPRVDSDWVHYGFSCVSMCNKFLVIGGTYELLDPPFTELPLVTNDVMQFDPFKKQWSRLANMETPRSHFACSVICGKVYVAGGCTLGLAEVYDPRQDRWEELPPMTIPQKDCIGLSFKGRLHVKPDWNRSEVFDPVDGKWCEVDETWPSCWAIQYTNQVERDDQVYAICDSLEPVIKTRDIDTGEWYNVGVVDLPSVVHSGYSGPEKSYSFGFVGYGFAAHRRKLYAFGGKLKFGYSAGWREDLLDMVRVCDPTVLPLKWKELKSMGSSAGGYIRGYGSIEENLLSD